MRGVFVLAVVLAIAPDVANAGRTPHGWLYPAEVLPERGVELQSWVFEETGKTAAAIRDTKLWWGVLIGATDQLELALPVEFLWRDSDLAEPEFTVHRFGIEARYRFVTQDPVDAPPLAPLVRLAVKRDVTTRDVVRAEADVVLQYECGRFGLLADLGFVGDIAPDDSSFELRPGLGVNVEVREDLRLGVEGYAQLALDDSERSWAIVGPAVAWTHGRFWLAGSFGIGVYQIDLAPRVVWGVWF